MGDEMLQSDRNKLSNLAYGLDNRPRVRMDKRRVVGQPIPKDDLTRLDIQENTKGLFVIITHDELTELADAIRDAAANDEDRMRVR